MSSPSDKELKGGHPPAVKAGGMRISRPRTTSGGEQPQKLSSSPKEEEYLDGPTKSERHNQQVLISGAVLKGDREFAADAIKQFHDKPEPSRAKPHAPQSHHIHQPK